MPKHDLQQLVNDNLRKYFDPMKKQHINTVVFNTGNLLSHEMKKAELIYRLLKEGRTIICEGIMKNTGLRPDVCVLDTSVPIAYEVVCSEKEESIIRKSETYGVTVVPIQSNSVWVEK